MCCVILKYKEQRLCKRSFEKDLQEDLNISGKREVGESSGVTLPFIFKI